MNRAAPRSIDAYLKQLRAELSDSDPALAQDALYDAEEYLRAEIAAHPGKSEADVLELIASTYGSPEEVAAAYQALANQGYSVLVEHATPGTEWRLLVIGNKLVSARPIAEPPAESPSTM